MPRKAFTLAEKHIEKIKQVAQDHNFKRLSGDLNYSKALRYIIEQHEIGDIDES